MPKNVIAFMVAVFLLSMGVFIYISEHTGAPTTVQLKEEIPQDVAHQDAAYQNRTMDIATFVSTHISELSPVQETLGGTFTVTDVTTANGKGTVRYDDGHTQYIADFNYAVSEDNGYTITKFRLRE